MTLALSPDDRWVAVATIKQVAVFDRARGHHVATLERLGEVHGLTFAGDGALWAYGPEGLWRWPWRQEAAGSWKVGPPRCYLARNLDRDALSIDRAGRSLALRTPLGPRLLRPAGRPAWVPLEAGAGDFPVLRPDGQLAAAASATLPSVFFLDAKTGRRLRDLPAEPAMILQGFSADGRWLAAATRGGRVRTWDTGSWEEAPVLQGTTSAFAPDRPLQAVETGEGKVRLIEPGTGHEFATLEDPNQDLVPPRTAAMAFARDGAQLMTISFRPTMAAHVWDLRLLRRELATLGLDWDAPAYPDAPAGEAGPLPSVRVEYGSLPLAPQAMIDLCTTALECSPFGPIPEVYAQRALAHARLGHVAKALADYSRAVELAPDVVAYREPRWRLALRLRRDDLAAADWQALIERKAAGALHYNNLAWHLVTGPEARRAPKPALALAEEAMRREPRPVYRNTLAVALYRVGRYEEARRHLAENLKSPGPG